ncbi:MAG TPA: hypothetical protein P5543_04605 [Planctomycetota bacterium]|nr:hypothetical protein [Planctomycetota bacterium]
MSDTIFFNVALGRQMLLWEVALGRETCTGRENLLWGGKLLWERICSEEVMLGSCSGEAMLLWGGKCCSGGVEFKMRKIH